MTVLSHHGPSGHVRRLFALGAAKVRLTGLNPWRSGTEMLLVGGLAAAVAYGVGALLNRLGD